MNGRRFNGVKVFSATMFQQRDQLGDTVTAWIAANPRFEVVDIVVTQSSDASFHCIAITLFYWEPAAPIRRASSGSVADHGDQRSKRASAGRNGHASANASPKSDARVRSNPRGRQADPRSRPPSSGGR